MQAVVTAVDEESVTIDANHPLAGKQLAFEVQLTRHIPAAQLEYATFGAGCFWSVELAFQRVPGVLQTAVGYSQGRTPSPTYEDVSPALQRWLCWWMGGACPAAVLAVGASGCAIGSRR